VKIEHISIKNVFQHGKLEIDAEGSLVGLIGPNGSGKSNLLKCIQFAFSGEVPGKVKEQFLKWGEKSGSVTVSFTHQGKPGVITRATGQGKTSHHESQRRRRLATWNGQGRGAHRIRGAGGTRHDPV